MIIFCFSCHPFTVAFQLMVVKGRDISSQFHFIISDNSSQLRRLDLDLCYLYLIKYGEFFKAPLKFFKI